MGEEKSRSLTHTEFEAVMKRAPSDNSSGVWPRWRISIER